MEPFAYQRHFVFTSVFRKRRRRRDADERPLPPLPRSRPRRHPPGRVHDPRPQLYSGVLRSGIAQGAALLGNGRELLLFWTIRQTCFVAFLGTATVCAVISLALGEVGGSNLVGQLLARAGTFFG
jgi:hypothetical protein